MQVETQSGDYVFFRGGIDEHHVSGCGSVATSSNPCAIPIRHHDQGPSSHYYAYNSWRQDDHYLDWHGAEQGQGHFNGQQAQGSPGIWTTNQQDGHGYSHYNTYGQHYWLLDIDMDCTRTEHGFFEFKGFRTGPHSGWVDLPGTTQPACSGTGSYPPPPYPSENHFARCGYVNVYHRMGGSCEINNL